MGTLSAPVVPYVAVVLAGGTGQRLGGRDKAALRLEGRTLLDRLLDAVGHAAQVVVVGPPRPTQRPVTWAREDPPGGGPGAGLLAGLDAAGPGVPDLLLVVAVDMAHVGRTCVDRLLDAAGGSEGAVLVGTDGRRQLCAVLSTAALTRVRPSGSTTGLPVHRLLGDLALVEVPAEQREAEDVDTPEDLARLHGEHDEHDDLTVDEV